MYSFQLIDSGSYNEINATQARIELGELSYLYRQNIKTQKWSITEVRADGSLGAEIQSGEADQIYDLAFTYTIEGNTYLFGMDIGKLHFLSPSPWEIYAIHSDGKLGAKTDRGIWNNTYECIFGYEVSGEHFLYGASTSGSDRWFIQPLLAGGKMGGKETDHGKQKHKLQTNLQVPIYLAQSSPQLFAFDDHHHQCRANDFLAGGALSRETTESEAPAGSYAQILYLDLPERPALLALAGSEGQNSALFELNEGGKLGKSLAEASLGSGNKGLYFPLQGRHFIYLFSDNDTTWLMYELVME